MLGWRNSAVVEFCAAGTRMELLFVPTCAVDGCRDLGIRDDRHIVALLNFRTVHHFDLGWVHPNYIAEKLRVAYKDATNLSALFAALGRDVTEIEEYLSGLPMCPIDKDSIADGEIAPI